MQTIEIDDLVWEKLQSLAAPFVDTPNAVLRRLLRISGNGVIPLQGSRSSKKTSYGRAYGRTPQSEFRAPILRVLLRLGYRGRAGLILDEVGSEMGDALNEVDKRRLESGNDIRWRNAAQWERQVMVNEGLLRDDSPKGTWELTESGLAKAKELA